MRFAPNDELKIGISCGVMISRPDISLGEARADVS